LKSATAENCSKLFVEEIYLRYGVPRRVISDNGTQFVSAVMQCVMDSFGIRQCLTPSYHAEANPVERKNRDIKTQLSIAVAKDHLSWDERLPAIRYAMNTSYCESIGKTPAFLTFGRELRSTCEIQHDLRRVDETVNFVPQIEPYLRRLQDTIEDAKELNQKQQDKRKAYADRRRRSKIILNVGDNVLVATHVLSSPNKGISGKLAPRRDGSYVISKVISPTSYEISSKDGKVLGHYHARDIVKFLSDVNVEVNSSISFEKTR